MTGKNATETLPADAPGIARAVSILESGGLVAVPTADRGARTAYKVTFGADLSGANPTAYSSYVDARDGVVLVRENLVDSDSDNPRWEVFPATPPTSTASASPTR